MGDNSLVDSLNTLSSQPALDEEVRLEYSFEDQGVQAGQTYQYRIKGMDCEGKANYSQDEEVAIGMPERTEMHRAYPNPASDQFFIDYSLAASANVGLKLYDIRGTEVHAGKILRK